MTKEHFTKLVEENKTPLNKYIFTSLNKKESTLMKRAISFIYNLQTYGIPLDVINVNDWRNSSAINVYLGIPFKDRVKVFKRFSIREGNSAFICAQNMGYIK